MVKIARLRCAGIKALMISFVCVNGYLCVSAAVYLNMSEPCGTLSSQERVQVPVYHPTPSQTRLATQLTEEEQIRIAQRIGLIQHLPRGIFDPGSEPNDKKVKE